MTSGRIRTEALLLARHEFRESSIVATFFTRRLGRIRGLAKGVHRPRSRFAGMPDLLARMEMVVLEKTSGQLNLILEWDVLDSWPGFRHSARALQETAYLAELLTNLTPENDPAPDLFDLTAHTLRRFAAGSDGLVLESFEAQALRMLGFMPRTRLCAGCGAPPPRGEVFFGPRQGGVLCTLCAPSDPDAVPARADTLAIWNALAHSRALPDRVRCGAETRETFRRLADTYISHIVGRRMRVRLDAAEPAVPSAASASGPA